MVMVLFGELFSIFSKRLTPAAARFPMISAFLAKIDLRIRLPKRGIFNTKKVARIRVSEKLTRNLKGFYAKVTF